MVFILASSSPHKLLLWNFNTYSSEIDFHELWKMLKFWDRRFIISGVYRLFIFISLELDIFSRALKLETMHVWNKTQYLGGKFLWLWLEVKQTLRLGKPKFEDSFGEILIQNAERRNFSKTFIRICVRCKNFDFMILCMIYNIDRNFAILKILLKYFSK